MLLRLPVPQTQPFSFVGTVIGEDAALLEHLQRCTEARDRFCATSAVLENRAEEGRASVEATITNLEEYIPLLHGLILFLEETKHALVTSTFEMSWTSCLVEPSPAPKNSRSPPSPTYYRIKALRFDLIMSTLTLAVLKINQARDVVYSAPSVADLMEALSRGAQLLLQAAGILDFLTVDELPRYHKFPASRPPELNALATRSIYCACMAQAQEMCVRRAELEEKGPSIIGRLSSPIPVLYTEALENFQALAAQESSTTLIRLFTAKCTNSSSYHSMLTYLSFAQMFYDKHELATAIAVVSISKAYFNYFDFETPPVDTTMQDLGRELLAKAENLYEAWSQENRLVYHEIVKPVDSSVLPEGRLLVKKVAYESIPCTRLHAQLPTMEQAMAIYKSQSVDPSSSNFSGFLAGASDTFTATALPPPSASSSSASSSSASVSSSSPSPSSSSSSRLPASASTNPDAPLSFK